MQGSAAEALGLHIADKAHKQLAKQESLTEIEDGWVVPGDLDFKIKPSTKTINLVMDVLCEQGRGRGSTETTVAVRRETPTTAGDYLHLPLPPLRLSPMGDGPEIEVPVRLSEINRNGRFALFAVLDGDVHPVGLEDGRDAVLEPVEVLNLANGTWQPGCWLVIAGEQYVVVVTG